MNLCSEIPLSEVDHEVIQFESVCTWIEPKTGEIHKTLTEYGKRKKIEREREKKLKDLLSNE